MNRRLVVAIALAAVITNGSGEARDSSTHASPPGGRCAGLTRRTWTAHPAPGTDRGTEFDGPEVWGLVADALAEVTAGRGADVAGVAVTAVRLGCALIGA